VRALMLVIAVLACALAAPGADSLDCGLVAGWKQQGTVRSFDAGNLFEYVDGEAEGYLIQGFVQMRGVSCASGGVSLEINISEMADPESAYGIFSTNLDPSLPIEKIGMGGQIQPQRAAFCKGKYYVELAADTDEDYAGVLRKFAEGIEKRVTGTSEPPRALAWFPPEKLIAVRRVPESVLGMSALKSGYAAEYEFGKAFVVEEESPEAAAAVMESARKNFRQPARADVADEAFVAEDKYLGKLCFFRKGRFVAGYANLSDAEDAPALARTLAARLP
jgi:hypothetical protein